MYLAQLIHDAICCARSKGGKAKRASNPLERRGSRSTLASVPEEAPAPFWLPKWFLPNAQNDTVQEKETVAETAINQ
jgi:hypothetical protein